MSSNPDSKVDLASDLTLAAQYGKWASRFTNDSPPGDLTTGGAWGHVARWLATKGSDDITLRATGVTGNDLLTNALLAEPSHPNLGFPAGWYQAPYWTAARNRLGPNSRGNQSTLRGMLLWGVNRSPDRLVETWTSNGERLAQAIARTIEIDPDPDARLEALKLVNGASFPLKRWSNAILPALDRAQAILAETPFDAKRRQSLAALIQEVRARLLSLLAEAASLPPLPGGDVLAPAASRVPWKWILGVGGAAIVATLIGVRVYQNRRALPAGD